MRPGPDSDHHKDYKYLSEERIGLYSVIVTYTVGLHYVHLILVWFGYEVHMLGTTVMRPLIYLRFYLPRGCHPQPWKGNYSYPKLEWKGEQRDCKDCCFIRRLHTPGKMLAGVPVLRQERRTECVGFWILGGSVCRVRAAECSRPVFHVL